MDEKLGEQIALFRYGVIADLVRAGSEPIEQRLLERAGQSFQVPGSARTRIGRSTLRDWIRSYRNGGFDALKPRARADHGASRRLPREVIDLLVTLKEEHPQLSVRSIIEKARASVPGSLPPSTVYRMLARRGLMQPAQDDPGGKDRRRFAFQRAGELWMSDVMHGPGVFAEGRRKRKAYLIAFLDDATRVVPHAAFAFSETVSAFLGVFKTAIERRGIPDRLYVDNGAAYRSHHLSLVCAQLGITLIHTRPYDPAAKGKQERFFRTVRMQLLPQLSEQDLQSLEAINRRLWRYIEAEYHQNPHRGLDGHTPLDRWAGCAGSVRMPRLDIDLNELFLDEQKRRVHKDRTVNLHGRVLEVDAMLVGSTVTLRFDPERLDLPVRVFKDGKRFTDAQPVDAYANCFVRRHRASDNLEASRPPVTTTSSLRLSELARRKKEEG
jgi:transposase InsO family protein